MAKKSMRGLPVGNLTPRSNNPKVGFRYSGGFGNPDGFSSVLNVKVNSAGDCCLTIHQTDTQGKNSSWSVMLTSEQRKHLASILTVYEPTLWEDMKEEMPP